MTEEGRLIGHLALGPRSSARRPAGCRPSAGRRCCTACSPITAPTASAGPGGAASARPEALALYRLNALDAGVKGALEHGL